MKTSPRVGSLLFTLPLLLAMGCDDGESDDPEPEAPDAAVLSPEPAGSPDDPVEGRWSCLDRPTEAAAGNALELVGYVRTLADPDANDPPPAARVEAFGGDGASLGEGFADPGKDGRVSVTIPVREEGFTGYAVVSEDGFMDWRVRISRAVTDTTLNAWAWLTTRDEVDERAEALGLAYDEGKGILVGSIHDCDDFGTENVLVLVGGDAEGVRYVEGFDIVADRTFSSATGRFVLPNVSPGNVEVEAYGRLDDRGKLVLLSSATATVQAGKITAVSMLPRPGAN